MTTSDPGALADALAVFTLYREPERLRRIPAYIRDDPLRLELAALALAGLADVWFCALYLVLGEDADEVLRRTAATLAGFAEGL